MRENGLASLSIYNCETRPVGQIKHSFFYFSFNQLHNDIIVCFLSTCSLYLNLSVYF